MNQTFRLRSGLLSSHTRTHILYVKYDLRDFNLMCVRGDYSENIDEGVPSVLRLLYIVGTKTERSCRIKEGESKDLRI